MKKIACLLCLSLLLCALTACAAARGDILNYAPLYTIPHYTPKVHPTYNPDEVLDYGLMYTNENWNFLCYILEKDWHYTDDPQTGQVIFYPGTDPTINCISLFAVPSTQEFGVMVKEYIHAAEKAFKKDAKAKPGQIYSLKIGPDAQLDAVAQPYAYQGDQALNCAYYYWQNGDMFYVLSVVSDLNNLDRMRNAVSDILNSVRTMPQGGK